MTIQKLLAAHDYLILDGALGTMIIAAGLEQGQPPEVWNVLYPERVRAIHQGYIEAGSQIILTNSFGGNQFRLKLYNLQDRVIELNQVAATIARAVADAALHPVVVAGSIGPTGEPQGQMSEAQATASFSEQAIGLVQGGVDLFWIETMSDLNEVKAAISGIRSVSQLPIAATLTFDRNGQTTTGVTAKQAILTLRELNLVAIGANCGYGPHEIEAIITTMRATDPTIPLIAKSNAGLPQQIDDTFIYQGTPTVMATYAHRVYHLGARLMGGCCGTTPTHIQAMTAVLRGSMPIPEITSKRFNHLMPKSKHRYKE